MNIWIISLFDPTPFDNTQRGRYIGIGSEGNRLGHNITHFSCTFRHSSKVQRFEKTHIININDGYKVVYILASPYKKSISLRRLLSHREFTQNLKRFINNWNHPDIILVAFPPISPSYYLTRWAKRNGIPIIIDIIDTWPDDLLGSFPKSLKFLFKLILYPLYYELNVILKYSSGVIAISNEYVTWAKSFGHSINKSGTFFPSVPYRKIRDIIERQKFKSKENKSEKIRLIYAGSLGVTYDIPVILKAAEIIEKKHPGKTEFLIIGAGHYQYLVLEYINKCDNIKYLGRLDHNDLIIQYALADIGLAQYPDNATQSVTYKFFDYLSAGLPILNSLMTEMAVMTEKYQVGFNNPPGNAYKLTENIEKFLLDRSLLEKYKQNALIAASSKGDSEIVYKELVNFLISFK